MREAHEIRLKIGLIYKNKYLFNTFSQNLLGKFSKVLSQFCTIEGTLLITQRRNGFTEDVQFFIWFYRPISNTCFTHKT